MNSVLQQIKNVSDSIAINYNLDIGIFLVIYLVSFIPFYGGYLLIFYGTTRKFRWRDFFNLNSIRGKLQWNNAAKWGLFIHLFGRIMPYVYILINGENLPIGMYIILWGIIVLSVFFGIKKIFSKRKRNLYMDIQIIKKNIIADFAEEEILWNIYNETFGPLNKISPCKQSFDKNHFIDVLHEPSAIKYLMQKEGVGVIGMSIISNNFRNTPWISEDYFHYKYPAHFEMGKIYYFIGIAIDDRYRGNKYSILLIEHVIDDLPKDIIIGFDHSRNINPYLHFFPRIIKQSPYIRRISIDSQHYHLLKYKR